MLRTALPTLPLPRFIPIMNLDLCSEGWAMFRKDLIELLFHPPMGLYDIGTTTIFPIGNIANHNTIASA